MNVTVNAPVPVRVIDATLNQLPEVKLTTPADTLKNATALAVFLDVSPAVRNAATKFVSVSFFAAVALASYVTRKSFDTCGLVSSVSPFMTLTDLQL